MDCPSGFVTVVTIQCNYRFRAGRLISHKANLFLPKICSQSCYDSDPIWRLLLHRLWQYCSCSQSLHEDQTDTWHHLLSVYNAQVCCMAFSATQTNGLECDPLYGTDLMMDLIERGKSIDSTTLNKFTWVSQCFKNLYYLNPNLFIYF